MRILVEEYRYDRIRAGESLSGLDAIIDADGSTPYVGYYYHPGSGASRRSSSDDLTFILPKVVMDEQGRIFGKYAPEDMIFPKFQNLTDGERRFMAEFPIWLYRAINVYRQDGHSDSSIIRMSRHADIGKNHGRKYDTYLDILLALLEFNRENRNFFFYILRNIHSGYNRINWTRTIATTDAIVQDETPVYISPVNRKRQINFDEELLIIFYSILNYMSEAYGFPKAIDLQFDLITGKKFEKYLRGYGKTRLHQIKYKYFSDKALKLWNLCYDFFDMASDLVVSDRRSDYLLAKDFNIVFEAIIDELIGEKVLPDDMDKKQEDGKIVDHMYVGQSLFEGFDRKVYYIGDSKYYKPGNDVQGESVYKQYTYARNAIQWNMDIINGWRSRPKEESGVILRDYLTEGYNIIPNFFISAFIDGSFDYTDGKLRLQSPAGQKDGKPHYWHKRMQFGNRLFDRDTMYLFYYKVNFLFILSLYSRNNISEKKAWKDSVRKQIRSDIQWALDEIYDFYAIKAIPAQSALASGNDGLIKESSKDNAEEYIRANFNSLVGKIFAPYDNNEDIFLVALDKGGEYKSENNRLLADLEKHFYWVKCSLTDDPREAIEKKEMEDRRKHAKIIKPNPITHNIDNSKSYLSILNNGSSDRPGGEPFRKVADGNEMEYGNDLLRED